MEYVVVFLLMVTVYTFYLLGKASKKIKQLEEDKAKNIRRMSRFHDIRLFDKEMAFFSTHFFDYVMSGKRNIKEVKNSIKLAYDLDKNKTVHTFIRTEQETRSQNKKSKFNDHRPTA